MSDAVTTPGTPGESIPGVDPNQVIRRVIRHLIPFLVLVFALNMLNRVNIGFAALQMNRAIGLTATAFGIAGSGYWIGSVLVEVPGTMSLDRWGARRILAAILIMWGLVGIATGFVQGVASLVGVRILLGIAEGCGQPGILLYLTYWIPESHRARVNSRFFLCLPITNALASPLSAFIMQNTHRLGGLDGWRWMYILEGFPSVIVGIIALYFLTDRPKEANWLTEPERNWLQETIEKSHRGPRKREGMLSAFGNPLCYVFGMGWFGIAFFMSAITTFLPLVVRQLGYRNVYQIATISSIPFIVGLVAMLFWGSHSDKKKERMWHAIIAALVGGFGWFVAYFLHSPALIIASIAIAAAGMYGAQATFWALPPAVFTKKQMGVALALIATVGQFGGLIAPIIFGRIRDITGVYNAAYLTVTAAMIITAIASLSGTYWGRAIRRREVALESAACAVTAK
jgi:ACS family 4-hydroxyphenylacetate permease-like MFS transporter